ncbi:hypothetical protein ACFSTH_07005 [Paenibacillus yanchengensis]|uniref:Uncharacterized protein n=1 Tax=Paenibacillus yanchengensis TaxID=2035833 RepID=A0ABW4YHX3_9BACL
MKKRLKSLSFIITITVLFSTSTNAYAANNFLSENSHNQNMEVVRDIETGQIIYKDDASSDYSRARSGYSPVTVEDIDKVMDERAQALLAGSMERYYELDEKLMQMGVRKISYDDVVALTSNEEDFTMEAIREASFVEDYSNLSFTSSQSSIDRIDVEKSIMRANTETTFENYYTTLWNPINSQWYDVWRVTASPNGNLGSSLSHRVSTSVTSTKSTDAITMKFLGITVSSVAGELLSPPYSYVKTVYDAYREMGNFMSPTTKVNNVDVHYLSNIAEINVFMYFKLQSHTTYPIVPGGLYSKINYTQDNTLMILNGNIPANDDVTYTGTVSAEHYNNASYAFGRKWETGRPYISQIKRYNITGVGDKQAYSINMKAANTPQQLN